MLLLNKHNKQKDHLLEMNLNKVDISHCINQDLIDDTVLWLLWKGIVIDPFKWSKWHQLYCKECLDYILSNDIWNDGTTGWISYS